MLTSPLTAAPPEAPGAGRRADQARHVGLQESRQLALEPSERRRERLLPRRGAQPLERRHAARRDRRRVPPPAPAPPRRGPPPARGAGRAKGWAPPPPPHASRRGRWPSTSRQRTPKQTATCTGRSAVSSARRLRTRSA